MSDPTDPKQILQQLREQHRALVDWAQLSERSRDLQITLLASLVESMRRTLAELEARLP
jgi:acyl-CoA reductase-like NAD-dependent aldehyde dehydrogenase